MFDDTPWAQLELEYTIDCPHCGEPNDLLLDPETAGQLIQDCEVCCRPYRLTIRWSDGHAHLRVDATD